MIGTMRGWIMASATALAFGAPLGATAQTAPPPATRPAAQMAAEAAIKWGLIGTWAPSCERPPGDRNVYVRYVARDDGRVVMERDLGAPARNDTTEVLAAVIGKDGNIEVVIDLRAFAMVRVYALAKDGDKRLRALWNRQIGGDHTIRDGRFTANGAEVPWQYRCG
ncbi:MAG: hypothetical protein IPK81_17360 [Rhodospirillales bacterium]|nr:MAG: hypothetical protein IPK81_17360 [Rhodospirillales bacterium]